MSAFIANNIGRYQIVEQLDQGGMATVYKAHDTRLDRYVAIKIINAAGQSGETFLKRFEREAKALAQLSHPNIVKVYDYGEEDKKPYLVMEFISGGTLKNRVGKPFSVEQAIRTLLPVARALAFAHERKIVHRDVKPANILITDSGEPMLSDFGIAKIVAQGAAALTGVGVGIGTPEYMAPEQGQGALIDHRADIYSLGIVFYELLTGSKPFQADTPVAVVLKQISDPFPNPRIFVPDLNPQVEAFLNKALTKDPAERYQSMAEVVSLLEGIYQDEVGSRLAATPYSGDSLFLKKTSIDSPTFDVPVSVQAIPTFSAPSGTIDLPIRAVTPSVGPISSPDQTSPPARKRDKKNLFFNVGMIILVITGLIGLAGLGMYVAANGNQFNDPEFDDFQEAASPVLPSTAPDATLENSQNPRIGTAVESRQAYHNNVVTILELAPEQYSEDERNKVGNIIHYSVALNASRPVLFFTGWCAASQAILDQNLGHQHFEFYVNDTRLSDANLASDYYQSSDKQFCYGKYSLLDNWPAGKHTLITKIVFDEKINDGSLDFNPGTLTDEFTVTVK